MTSGIDYLHGKKILHRDLKPANVFLTSWFQLKIGDFGISKSLSETLDMASTMCGTPVYIAPEVFRGEPYDNKADIWSLGCILFELATLKLAFGGNNFFQDISKVKKLFLFIFVTYKGFLRVSMTSSPWHNTHRISQAS